MPGDETVAKHQSNTLKSKGEKMKTQFIIQESNKKKREEMCYPFE